MFKSKQNIIMALLKIKGLGNAKVNDIYKSYIKNKTDIIDIYEGLKKLYDIDSVSDSVDQDIKYAKDNGIHIITIADDDFPEIENNKIPNADKPVILYYIGNLKLLSSDKNIAIIGTRTPAETAVVAGKELTEQIVARGFNVISGLANGCDSIAHKTAIENHAKTIAFLPTPPNKTKINIELAQGIKENNGLLVSEYLYPDKSRSEYSRNCTQRDKLVVMFSKQVFLISANNNSGSAITISKALKYGILVSVIEPKAKTVKDDFSLNFDLLEKKLARSIKWPGDYLELSELHESKTQSQPLFLL